MARYTGPVCRLCRRETTKLFLKGDRCYTDKCALERRNYAPGQHGQGRGKASDYGTQLREKQRMKRTYGLLEKQFRAYFDKADRMKGVTGENLLVLLERRLDSVVYRLGFTSSRAEARALVRQGHFLVNGRKVNVPSYILRVNDVVELREKSRKVARINEALDGVMRRGLPSWVELDRDAFKGSLKTLPVREEMTTPAFQEQLIVELYSK
ncbi:MAG: 30S ribosomal protein S4 [Syntrophotalea acetylenica]|uniref:Small ribosomal subunit protein uS4 n=1 Tax=Syntrophotalea acetylenica TaxID=29542 RepID=A0A1L3GDY0_SYNAC|nr:30S ribosomal protein S4 [Syntrophotalea acetylenica]APG24172.1 30S ribosomal protein S4 [Syntrophotalea acetylenica]APG44753.1 30S ribosomal protein S4 [Syntrophotalea acetylenica]MDD4456744.1 30S ribosomal protein S4 [Syntrophotalea acetylenica]MDY0261871.1 30S ribosomal protein S4 [Syntrophotalea acetylenica]